MKNRLITALVCLAALTAFACTEAEKVKYGGLHTGQVTCYSGAKVIYEGQTRGLVQHESQSAGYFFVEQSGRFVQVLADCVVTYGAPVEAEEVGQ